MPDFHPYAPCVFVLLRPWFISVEEAFGFSLQLNRAGQDAGCEPFGSARADIAGIYGDCSRSGIGISAIVYVSQVVRREWQIGASGAMALCDR